MKRLRGVLGIMALGIAATVTVAIAQDDEDKPKFSIKQVMKECMKGGLCKKVAKGEASDEEKEKLVEMFVALSKNTPPKGEAESWKKKTTALVKAAKGCVEGKGGAGETLTKAANCMECHKAHKGS